MIQQEGLLSKIFLSEYGGKEKTEKERKYGF